MEIEFADVLKSQQVDVEVTDSVKRKNIEEADVNGLVGKYVPVKGGTVVGDLNIGDGVTKSNLNLRSNGPDGYPDAVYLDFKRQDNSRAGLIYCQDVLPNDPVMFIQSNAVNGDVGVLSVGINGATVNSHRVLDRGNVITEKVDWTVGPGHDHETLEEAWLQAGLVSYAGGQVTLRLEQGTHIMPVIAALSLFDVNINLTPIDSTLGRPIIHWENRSGDEFAMLYLTLHSSRMLIDYMEFTYDPTIFGIVFNAMDYSDIELNACIDTGNTTCRTGVMATANSVGMIDECVFDQFFAHTQQGSDIVLHGSTLSLSLDLISLFPEMFSLNDNRLGSRMRFKPDTTIVNTSTYPTYALEFGVINNRGSVFVKENEPLRFSTNTYEFTKVSAITLTETETLIATLDLTGLPAGLYEQGYSFEVNFGGLKDKSVHFRADVDGVTGTVFDTQSDKKSNHKNRRYSYPKQRVAGAYKMEFYMWKETGVTQEIIVDWCDVTLEWKRP